MSDDLPFSKAKQLGKASSEKLSPEEKRKQKAKEYRAKQYEKQKERLELARKEPVRRVESKKQAEIKKEVSELFQFFLARCKDKQLEPHSKELSAVERSCAAQMLKAIGRADAETAIAWAIENWHELLEKDDRLSREPYFYNLTAHHRFTYYLRRATAPVAANATKKEVSTKVVTGLLGDGKIRLRATETDHS